MPKSEHLLVTAADIDAIRHVVEVQGLVVGGIGVAPLLHGEPTHGLALPGDLPPLPAGLAVNAAVCVAAATQANVVLTQALARLDLAHHRATDHVFDTQHGR